MNIVRQKELISDGKLLISIQALLGRECNNCLVECDSGEVRIDNSILVWCGTQKDEINLIDDGKLIMKLIVVVKDETAINTTDVVKTQIATQDMLGKSQYISDLYGIDVVNVRKQMSLLQNKILDRPPSSYVVLSKVGAFVDKSKEIYYYPGYPSYTFKLPVNWSESDIPYDKRSWRYGFNSWVFMDSILATRKQEDLIFAKHIALDWYKFNVEQVNYNEFAWYDMSVAFRATRIPYIIEHCLRSDLLTESEFFKLSHLLCLHLLDLSDKKKLAKHSNHGLYQLAGLLAITNILPEIRNFHVYKDYATFNLLKILSKDVNEEGLHLEHSPAYHIYVTEILEAISNASWVDDQRFNRLVKLMDDNTYILSHPNGKLIRFGDTSERDIRKLLKFSSNPFVKFAVSKGAEGSSPSNIKSVFPKSGYAFLRSGWDPMQWSNASFLAFSAAFHKRTHKHADDFNFEWSEQNQRILIDAGMFGYERDAVEREYVQTTRAHNCVEIDEQDYSRYNLDVFGSAITAWSEKSDVKLVEAYLYRKRFFKTHHRRVLLIKPGAWLLVIDHLKSQDKHKFTQWFHFHPDLLLKQELDKTFVDMHEDTRVWVDQFDTDSRIEHIKAQFEPRLQGWTSLEPYKLTPNDALGYTVDDKAEHTFATLFSFGKEDAKPKLDLLKSSSNGKYIRAKWKTPNGDAQDIIYRISEDNRELTINGESIGVSIRGQE
jgi:hypothetical protein